MKEKRADECIHGILTEIENRKHVDYRDSASVRRFNAAYKRCFGYMKYIDDHYPNQIDAIVQLLSIPDHNIIGHCAPMILRLEHSTKEQKQIALRAIRGLLLDPQVDMAAKMGFSTILEEWANKV